MWDGQTYRMLPIPDVAHTGRRPYRTLPVSAGGASGSSVSSGWGGEEPGGVVTESDDGAVAVVVFAVQVLANVVDAGAGRTDTHLASCHVVKPQFPGHDENDRIERVEVRLVVFGRNLGSEWIPAHSGNLGEGVGLGAAKGVKVDVHTHEGAPRRNAPPNDAAESAESGDG